MTTTRPLLFGVAAYTMWGVVPAYWKLVERIAPVELLAYRVVWGLVIALLLLAISGSFRVYWQMLTARRVALAVGFAAALLAGNWLVFIHAVTSGQIMATSLGYYLNPLISVVLGLLVLGERLSPVRWIAVLLAAVGVGGYVVALGELPWISVALALSFGLYGLVRKLAPAEPIVGFAIEMTLLSVPAFGFIARSLASGTAGLPAGRLELDLLVAASGIVTAAPLLCFNVAARGLPLVTVGILQYIAPSIALLLAVVVYGEPFESAHLFTFGMVWVALAIFTGEAVLRPARPRTADPVD